MKTFLCLLAMVLPLAKLDAAGLHLNGDLKWNITVPQCEFRLQGQLQNLSALGTGSLKLVLWATKTPYPSPGYMVGEYPLPALGAGLQFNSFTVKTKSDLPFVNDEFYFTIAVVEYTTAGWRNQLLVPTGTRVLYNGNFADQQKWTIPSKAVITPPLPLVTGDVIELNQKATGDFNEFPAGWRDKTKLKITSDTKLTYTLEPRSESVSYDYSVIKTRLKGQKEKVWAGKLVMTYQVGDNITFKNIVTLYYQGQKTGTYKSVVKGYLFDGELGNTSTWGSFKLKPAF